MVAPMAAPEDASKGIRRFHTGAVLGIAGGMLGLVLPMLINLVAYLGLDGLVLFGMSLVQITTLLVLLGAILLAISLICYRFGFSRLRKFDRSFYIASVLCIIGSIGLLLIIVPTALVLLATPSLVHCVRSSPRAAVTCLRTVQPAASYSLVAGFWLAWVGGLGVVVGLLLGGRRFRGGRLVAGAVSYALLLLVLIDPFIAVLFPTGGWQYPLLTIPVLAILAPAFVYYGSRGTDGYQAPRASATVAPFGESGSER
ncbi:MAG: hypothetical protein WA761_00065 [Thermoplasmata archaeon]